MILWCNDFNYRNPLILFIFCLISESFILRICVVMTPEKIKIFWKNLKWSPLFLVFKNGKINFLRKIEHFAVHVYACYINSSSLGKKLVQWEHSIMAGHGRFRKPDVASRVRRPGFTMVSSLWPRGLFYSCVIVNSLILSFTVWRDCKDLITIPQDRSFIKLKVNLPSWPPSVL